MDLIADGILILSTLSLAVYCTVISRRLKALRRLDSGMGAAVANMSLRVDDMRAAIDAAQRQSALALDGMTEQTQRAERAAGRLEMLLATLHDSRSQTAVPVRDTLRESSRKREFAGSLKDACKAMSR
ncbi:hypothetical protein [Roseobacter sp. HKCCA0434]|uniref:hypothetical protein n=1 Tax=Roseobacter sp. HKCCA0434 TaxID=3079297 RepID=UPI002905E4B6|nr:hypothetical protein [Roseobacter sp. HKCCA0434]